MCGFSFLFCLLAYSLAQQVYRMEANLQPIQMAEDAAKALNGGLPPQNLGPSGVIDMSNSLDPILIVYSSSSTPLYSSGLLNSKVPIPNAGVFNYVNSNGEDRLTWEPVQGVRLATVVTTYKSANGSGYVLAASSLREVEKNEDNALYMSGVLFVFLVIISFIGSWLLLA